MNPQFKSKDYTVGQGIIFFNLLVTPDKQELTEQHGIIREVFDTYAEAEVDLTESGVKGERGVLAPLHVTEDLTDDEFSVTVIARKDTGDIDKALQLICERINNAAAPYLDAYRIVVQRRGFKTTQTAPDELPNGFDVALILARQVRPQTALTLTIYQDLSKVKGGYAILMAEVFALLVREEFNEMASRFFDVAKNIDTLYPLMILAANYVTLERAELGGPEINMSHEEQVVQRIIKASKNLGW